MSSGLSNIPSDRRRQLPGPAGRLLEGEKVATNILDSYQEVKTELTIPVRGKILLHRQFWKGGWLRGKYFVLKF